MAKLQYKVVKVKVPADPSFMSEDDLEKKINETAKDGWELVTMTHAPIAVGQNPLQHAVVCTFKKPAKS